MMLNVVPAAEMKAMRSCVSGVVIEDGGHALTERGQRLRVADVDALEAHVIAEDGPSAPPDRHVDVGRRG